MATLYHVPTSRSFRVLWTLEEIGATVEVKSLGVRPRLQEPEYLAINPAGTLPALIDGDRAIYELLAICESSQPGMVPTWSWRRTSRSGRSSCNGCCTARRRFRRHSLSMRAKLLEQRLEGRDFLVAGRMTLADISVGYPLNTMGKPHFASLLGPRATAYRERLLARTAFQRAAAVP